MSSKVGSRICSLSPACAACSFFKVRFMPGPITASRTTNVIVNPMVSIVIGVTAFNERLRAGAGFVALDILAIVVLCMGVVILVRSPLVAGMGGGTKGNEYLGAGLLEAPVE